MAIEDELERDLMKREIARLQIDVETLKRQMFVMARYQLALTGAPYEDQLRQALGLDGVDLAGD